MVSELDKLSLQQRRLLAHWLPGAVVERDHSWGLVETTVLQVAHAGSRSAVRAGGENNHHTLVPAHGDWQPRNWLIHRGVVSIIDFGRAAMRPAMSDFARLAAQEFRRRPNLEAAFLDGYGSDPRERSAWHRNRVREAIGTAAWAYRVGDETFEAQGHRMIADALTAGGR